MGAIGSSSGRGGDGGANGMQEVGFAGARFMPELLCRSEQL